MNIIRNLIRRLLRYFVPAKSFSLFNMDVKLKKYLLPITNGFFIEAGANDGIRQSNTYLYEKKYGWKGLLVEPVPSLYQKCVKNRKAIVENYALSSKDHQSVQMKDYDLMSIVQAPGYEQYTKNAVRKYGASPSITVPTARLSTLLDKHHIQRIDFLSLDVEAYELEALRGLDLERHRPTFILIEDGNNPEIMEHMHHNRYEAIDSLSPGDVLFKAS